MKTVSLFLALIGGAGFLCRSQLQSLVGSHRQPADGVYYLRAAHPFTVPGGTVRWPAGRELRVAPQTADAGDAVTLTDGRSVSRVSRTNLMRDTDDAAVLRQIDAGDQDNERLAAQQKRAARFADLQRDALERTRSAAPSAGWSSRSETVASVSSAPVIYPYYRTVIVQTPPAVQTSNRVAFAQQLATVPRSMPLPPAMPAPRSMPVPRSTPPPPRVTPPPVLRASSGN